MVSKEAEATVKLQPPHNFLLSFSITYAFFTFPPTLYIASLWDWQKGASYLLGAIVMYAIFFSTASLLLALLHSKKKWLLGFFLIKYPLLFLLLFSLFKYTPISPLFFTLALFLLPLTMLCKSLRELNRGQPKREGAFQ